MFGMYGDGEFVDLVLIFFLTAEDKEVSRRDAQISTNFLAEARRTQRRPLAGSLGATSNIQYPESKD